MPNSDVDREVQFLPQKMYNWTDLIFSTIP